MPSLLRYGLASSHKRQLALLSLCSWVLIRVFVFPITGSVSISPCRLQSPSQGEFGFYSVSMFMLRVIQ